MSLVHSHIIKGAPYSFNSLCDILDSSSSYKDEVSISIASQRMVIKLSLSPQDTFFIKLTPAEELLVENKAYHFLNVLGVPVPEHAIVMPQKVAPLKQSLARYKDDIGVPIGRTSGDDIDTLTDEYGLLITRAVEGGPLSYYWADKSRLPLAREDLNLVLAKRALAYSIINEQDAHRDNLILAKKNNILYSIDFGHSFHLGRIPAGFDWYSKDYHQHQTSQHFLTTVGLLEPEPLQQKLNAFEQMATQSYQHFQQAKTLDWGTHLESLEQFKANYQNNKTGLIDKGYEADVKVCAYRFACLERFIRSQQRQIL